MFIEVCLLPGTFSDFAACPLAENPDWLPTTWLCA